MIDDRVVATSGSVEKPEFNLRQDPAASRVLLDSGVPLVLVPCNGVADRMVTTREEVDRYVRPAGDVGALLAGLYHDHVPDEPGRSKVIWDLAATAWVLHRDWVHTELTSSPILTSELTWSRNQRRHLILSATQVGRDEIFGDLFRRLATHSVPGLCVLADAAAVEGDPGRRSPAPPSASCPSRCDAGRPAAEQGRVLVCRRLIACPAVGRSGCGAR
jgi:hypothetical protein